MARQRRSRTRGRASCGPGAVRAREPDLDEPARSCRDRVSEPTRSSSRRSRPKRREGRRAPSGFACSGRSEGPAHSEATCSDLRSGAEPPTVSFWMPAARCYPGRDARLPATRAATRTGRAPGIRRRRRSLSELHPTRTAAPSRCSRRSRRWPTLQLHVHANEDELLLRARRRARVHSGRRRVRREPRRARPRASRSSARAATCRFGRRTAAGSHRTGRLRRVLPAAGDSRAGRKHVGPDVYAAASEAYGITWVG